MLNYGLDGFSMNRLFFEILMFGQLEELIRILLFYDQLTDLLPFEVMVCSQIKLVNLIYESQMIELDEKYHYSHQLIL